MIALFAKEAALIATLVGDLPQLPEDHTELACLARNMHYEARGEDSVGIAAVAGVTLNRVASHRWPDTICGVVYQDNGPQPWDCQFSWTCDGKSDLADGDDMDLYLATVRLAASIIVFEMEDRSGGATHYYAHELADPYWAASLTETKVIGGHTFLK